MQHSGTRTRLSAPIVNEHEARAAAGITLVLGAVAFVYAYFEHDYLPLQAVSVFFFLEFLVRVRFGLPASPIGRAAGWLVQRQPVEPVSARPKAFAWTLGLVMAGCMAVITNSGVRGYLPRTLCLICLTLMWLECALGLCLGCELHGFLRRRGWASGDEGYEICAHGACEVPQQGGAAR
jgi:hypothetical protein